MNECTYLQFDPYNDKIYLNVHINGDISKFDNEKANMCHRIVDISRKENGNVNQFYTECSKIVTSSRMPFPSVGLKLIYFRKKYQDAKLHSNERTLW